MSRNEQQYNPTGTPPQIINVGVPRHPSGWVSTHVKFHNFPHLLPTQQQVGQSLDSPIFTVHNVEWYLRVYPRGQNFPKQCSGESENGNEDNSRSNRSCNADKEESVSLYLRCKTAAENLHHHHHNNSTSSSNTSNNNTKHLHQPGIHAEFSLALYRTDHTLSHITNCPINKFGKKRKGWPEFITRKDLLARSNKLVDEIGTLTVVVSIQLYTEEGCILSSSNGGGCIVKDEYFIPNSEKSVHCRLLRLWKEANPSDIDEIDDRNYEEEEEEEGSCSTLHSSDVTFDIDGETLHAHRLILNMMSPTLASLCNSDNDEDNCNDVPIPIVGVRVEIFRYLLRYLYGGSIPEEVWNSTDNIHSPLKHQTNIFQHASMELLDTSNRFGVVDLKILAEVHVVQTLICIENASDLFLYADANNCALLKEQVIHYFKAHAREIRLHDSFQKVKESTDVMDQLMEALASARVYDTHEDRAMTVDLLRRKLHDRGLDADGSREMLIQRLAKWENKKTRARHYM